MNDKVTSSVSGQNEGFISRTSGLLKSTGKLVQGIFWYKSRGINISDGEWGRVKKLVDESQKLIHDGLGVLHNVFDTGKFHNLDGHILYQRIGALKGAIDIIYGSTDSKDPHKKVLVDSLGELSPYLPDIERKFLLSDDLDKVVNDLQELLNGDFSRNHILTDEIISRYNFILLFTKEYFRIARSALIKLRKSK